MSPPKLPRGLEPPISCPHNHPLSLYDKRLVLPVLPERGLNGVDILARVLSRITRIQHERINAHRKLLERRDDCFVQTVSVTWLDITHGTALYRETLGRAPRSRRVVLRVDDPDRLERFR